MTTHSNIPKFIALLREQTKPLIAARRAATPHVVPQPGLLRSKVGEDAFFSMIEERRKWIEENCCDHFIVDELRDATGIEIGRSYRFSNLYDATHFRMRF